MEKVTLVQKVVIKQQNNPEKFLMLIRNVNDKSRPGDYDIPGGSVKEGELHDEALIREVKEETNMNIFNIKPVIVKTSINKEDGKYFLYIGYSANTSDTNIKLNPKEHSEYLWLTLEDFKAKINSHVLLEQIEAAYK